MATEVKAKAPQDYTNSAVKLCNPEQLRQLLTELHARQKDLEEANAHIPEEIAVEIHRLGERISDLQKMIREAIDEHGSYQDMENGDYAVKYKRMSKVYHAEPFREHYPKFVPAVVVETINAKALEGMIKGGLIEEADLKMHKVITEDIGYAYYVR